MEHSLQDRLAAIDEKLEEIGAASLAKLDVLNFRQAAAYLDFSFSYLYKLTSTGRIPHSKPSGKKLYFDRRELDRWLLQRPVKTMDELDTLATERVVHGKRGGVA